MRVHWVSGLMAVTLLLGSSGARADIFLPPPYVGQPLTVQAEWEFEAPSSLVNDSFFDVFASVGGTDGETLHNGFQTHIDFDDLTKWNWTSGDGNGGVTPSEATQTLAANVQNWIDLLPIKFLRVQFTYQGTLAPSVIGVVGSDVNAGTVNGTPQGSGQFDATHRYEDWIILPNPDWEQIQIQVPFGTTLDELVINTQSVPEPSSLLLVGLSSVAMGVAAVFRRWHGRKGDTMTVDGAPLASPGSPHLTDV